MREGEKVSGQVHNPVTYLVVTDRDEASPLTIDGVANRKAGVADVAEMG